MDFHQPHFRGMDSKKMNREEELSVVCYLLPVICYLLPVICYLLSVVCVFLFPGNF